MSSPRSTETVERVEIFSRWVGFANPSLHAAKLTLTRSGREFVRQQSLAKASDVVPEALLTRVLAALAEAPIKKLDPSRFDVPAAALERYYNSTWTDDSPSHLIRISFADGGRLTIKATEQQAFMLPLEVIEPDSHSFQTFNPELSLALANLMPEGYPEKNRLAGMLGMLEHDAAGTFMTSKSAGSEGSEEPEASAEPEPPTEPTDPAGIEAAEQELFRILWGEESPEEKEDAEASGNISQRLLRRISTDDVRDLIARGADVSVADDVGQTALMHAAFPPFNQLVFRLLAEAGANVEARRNDGYTGLHLAAAGGESLAAAEWVRAGADVTARTPEGATPLMLAATWPDIVEMLLRKGVDVHAADNDGHTALVYAILNQSSIGAEGHLRALRLLLDRGANVMQPDGEGVTPLEHAENALARVQLEEEVSRAWNPYAVFSFGDWDDRRVAEEVVRLVRAARERA